MANRPGRRRGDRGGDHPRYLRPSERKGAGQPRAKPPRGEKPEVGKRRRRGEPHQPPSPEAIMRARARLQPPKPPWHPVPLAEMLIASGLALIVVAAVVTSRSGIYAAFMLVIVGTLEFTIREHRHGYRSHGAVIGVSTGFLTGAAINFAIQPQQKISLGIGVIVALFVWNGLSRTFEPADVELEKTKV